MKNKDYEKIILQRIDAFLCRYKCTPNAVFIDNDTFSEILNINMLSKFEQQIEEVCCNTLLGLKVVEVRRGKSLFVGLILND